MFGCRTYLPGLPRILRTATGFIRMTDGRGCRFIVGDGHRSITEGGILMLITDMCGCPATSGDPDGLYGDIHPIITDGLR